TCPNMMRNSQNDSPKWSMTSLRTAFPPVDAANYKPNCSDIQHLAIIFSPILPEISAIKILLHSEIS
ncbi:MAG: hypothetical protein RSD49_11145, partial [Hafnia sp.]|uniref:hypothetical protein n=1 Tax=Hafnia sp. TaxID=1873498 RepID=UPI002FCA0215